MNCAVAIFVKTPGHSAVKTRLWSDLGQSNAERLHRASAAAVSSVVANATTPSIKGYWATAEAIEQVAAEWAGFEYIEQGEGGLGLRMATVYRNLHRRHGAAILIGADTPQLQATALTRAADWLRSPRDRLVIGRSIDGGFWLFGGNCELPDSVWTSVDYSRATTAEQFMQVMQDRGDWLELDTLQDIDTAADIDPVRAQLAGLAVPTAEQTRLAVLLGELSPSRGWPA